MTIIKMPKQDFAKEFANQMTAIIFMTIALEEKERGVELLDAVASEFLTTFVNKLVHSRLTQKTPPKTPKEEVYEKVSKDYAKLKFKLQESIAVGFSNAMTKFTGYPVDYFCKITPVPDVDTNKQPC